MKSRPLTQVSFRINPEAGEETIALFERVFGVGGSVYQDARTGIATASVYVDQCGSELTARLVRLKQLLIGLKRGGVNLGGGRLRVQRVRREDWAESWKRHFKPLNLAGRLLIKPSWSKRHPRPGQAVVVLDPGLSFGTGHHATTAFCLRQLAKLNRCSEPQSLLDVGTGSGLLAIAAAKLGYRPIWAFDFDPEAVRIAKDNAGVNGVERLIRLYCDDVLQPSQCRRRQFTVICANLTDDLLLAACSRLVARLARGGTLVLAGIQRSQFSRVRAAYLNLGLKLMAQRAEKEWMSGAFLRPA